MNKSLLAAMPALFLSGCATIFSGSSDNVTFNSTPEGAKVEINGNSVGRTPVTVPIKRTLTPPQVQLKLDGYESRNVMVQNSFNGVSVLNIFFWPGFIIDAATGTLMKYDITTYNTELEAKEKSLSAK